MANYWKKRIKSQQDKLYDKSLADFTKEVDKHYKTSLRMARLELIDIHDKLMRDSLDGNIHINDLYRSDRYTKMIQFFNTELTNITKMQEQNIGNILDHMYYNQSTNVAKQLNMAFDGAGMQTKVAMQKAVNSAWCVDGKTWSERIWINKERLVDKMQRGLVDTVARGLPKDQLVKELTKEFSTHFYQADRIVRTELTHVQNQASTDRYKDAGVEYYEYLAEMDDRVSDECAELNGQIFRMDEATVGVNMPPMHPFAVALLYQYLNKSTII